MRKRVGIIVGLLLAGVLALMVWRASGPSEPVFEGRSLSSWLDHHVAASDAMPPYNSPGWKKADQALRTIGSNAVPTLVRMVRATDPPPFALKLLGFARRHGVTRVNYRNAAARHREAEYAFQVLGSNAASAVPELIKIYKNDASTACQNCAASALGYIGRQAQPAVPALIRRFSDTNSEVRFYAVSAIIHIGGDPNIVVPAVKTLLKDPKAEVRFNAVAALRSFGTQARAAIAELMEARHDEDQEVRNEVDDLLWGLVPEKVAKPLVVEESTPMVAEGITTEALSQRGWGYGPDEKLFTVIPQGKAVRCAIYQGVGDQPLYLYRGRTHTTAKDHFLGHFEAVPWTTSPTNINIEVAYIVDKERILLCARDHERKQFVELRRVENEAAK